MSLPDKCPFCGASVHVMEDGKECRSGVWVTFDCHTSLQTVADPRRFQSSECEVRERLRLAARVAELERDLEQAKADRARAAMDARNPLMAKLAELEARCKRMKEAGDRLEWRIACGCGQGVPCGNCANTLEAWQQAKEAKP